LSKNTEAGAQRFRDSACDVVHPGNTLNTSDHCRVEHKAQMIARTLKNVRAYVRLSVSYRRAILNTLLCKWQDRVWGTVLDVGGIRANPVGFVMSGKADVRRWLYLNISPTVAPDILADGAHIPLAAEAIDTVFCNATLEHVKNPMQVMQELSRVLRPAGVLLLGVPFLYRIHSAPNDFWRFTEYQVRRMAEETGLEIESMERVGLLFTVLCDMTKQAISEIRPTPLRWLIWLLLLPLATFLVSLERAGIGRNSSILTRFTTGYLVLATKAPKPGNVPNPPQTAGKSER
jgi:SAM-dependent methyltransferase